MSDAPNEPRDPYDPTDPWRTAPPTGGQHPPDSGSYDDTLPIDQLHRTAQPVGAAAPGDAPTATSARARPTRWRTAVPAAVLAGVLGGLGGAAGYDALNGPDATVASSDSALTRAVVSANDVSNPTTDSVEGVAALVLPSVVQINVGTPTGGGSGSGIILSPDGQVLTNNHVVELAAEGGSITVAFADGTTATARIVGRDPLTDLAVIQTEGVSGLTPATLGASGDLQVGQEVVAIGSPFGLESTVTSGIVSAVNRPVTSGPDAPGEESVFPGIQTDAAINPGNSGGPLVNDEGQVVGINSAIRTGSTGSNGSIGLGFAIPVDLARSIATQLAEGKPATHARLGVKVSNVTAADRITGLGAKVGGVTPGSAADDGGLRDGDVITAISSQRVTSADSLVAAVRGYRPGDRVNLTVKRGGEEREVTVTLGSDEGAPAS